VAEIGSFHPLSDTRSFFRMLFDSSSAASLWHLLALGRCLRLRGVNHAKQTVSIRPSPFIKKETSSSRCSHSVCSTEYKLRPNLAILLIKTMLFCKTTAKFCHLEAKLLFFAALWAEVKQRVTFLSSCPPFLPSELHYRLQLLLEQQLLSSCRSI